MTWRGYLREGLLAVGVLFCVGYAWLSTAEIAPNERSRIYLSVAMVDRGAFDVDPEVKRWGKNWDLSERDGKYYCNKPPGASLLGAAVYWGAKRVVGDGDWSIQGLFQLMRFGVMLPLALLGFVAIRRWMELLDFKDPVVDVASVGWMMGSAAFHYAGAFFSHHIVAVFLVTGFWLLERTRQRERRPERDKRAGGRASRALSMLLAGLALGLVGLTEYQAGVGCGFAAIWVLFVREFRRLRLIVPFALGAGLCLAGLFYYNSVAFGGPLQFSYDYHVSGSGEAISWPRLDYFLGLTFSLHRGIFTNAPWFLLMIPGVASLYARRRQSGTAVLLAAIVVFRIAFLSGYKWWSGDWGFGPRHMVPSMGVMTVLSAAAMDRWWSSAFGEALARGLVAVGIAYNQLQVAFIGELPLAAKNPLLDVALPLYGKDVPSPNVVASLTEWDGVETLVPLAVVAGAMFVFVLVRGLGRRLSWGRRVGVVVVALLPTIAFGWYLHWRGPNWSDEKRDNFSDHLKSRYESDLRWHRETLDD